jgi:hypothetical protein
MFNQYHDVGLWSKKLRTRHFVSEFRQKLVEAKLRPTSKGVAIEPVVKILPKLKNEMPASRV